jgi:hypothetical protein
VCFLLLLLWLLLLLLFVDFADKKDKGKTSRQTDNDVNRRAGGVKRREGSKASVTTPLSSTFCSVYL